MIEETGPTVRDPNYTSSSVDVYVVGMSNEESGNKEEQRQISLN